MNKLLKIPIRIKIKNNNKYKTIIGYNKKSNKNDIKHYYIIQLLYIIIKIR